MDDGAIQAKSLLAVLRGAIDRRVKQRSRDTLKKNALEDPAKPLAQRVVEEDACDFCQRLGNSKPVSPAKVASEYHNYCKCQIALLFQETKYKEQFTNEAALGSLGIETEPGANPDDWEVRDALVLAKLGKHVSFRAQQKGLFVRTSDVFVDGVRCEFKNPKGNGYLTIHNQVKSTLYGEKSHVLNPQSSRILISNVRSEMTMQDMEKGLARVLSGETGLTTHELSEIKEITLLDEKTMTLRRYILK